jgi:hypothetical protein
MSMSVQPQTRALLDFSFVDERGRSSIATASALASAMPPARTNALKNV